MPVLDDLDRFQRCHRWLAFPVAVYAKFSDDQAANLASLLAYYAFFSIFPLLLALATVLGFVLHGDPHLETQVFNSALGLFPIIGQHDAVHPLTGSLPALIIGSVLALWSGLAVAQQAQAAFNTVYNVPRQQWPGFLPRTLRSLQAVLLGGTGFIVTTLISGAVTGAGSYGLSLGVLSRVIGALVGIALNTALFTLLFNWLTVHELTWRDTLPGGFVAGASWYALQLLGTALITHKLKGAQSTYGTFATVIGLLTFFHLQAQLTLLGAEVNVVRKYRLCPRGLRSFTNQPTTQADFRAYTIYAQQQRYAAADEQKINVEFDSTPDTQQKATRRSRERS